MVVYIDDGSTNIKMMWQEQDRWVRHISPNSFCKEWAPSFGEQRPANYIVAGQRYSFNPVSPAALKHNHVAWQYSPENALAIQHALQTSGLAPQELDIVVTLPLSEYYDVHAQPNEENIQRKIANVKRAVEVNKGTPFTFNSVSVRPESIPAGLSVNTEFSEDHSILLIDLGGTTLDIAVVSGDMTNVFAIWGSNNIGVSIVTDAIIDILKEANTPTSALKAGRFILLRDDLDAIVDAINNPEYAEKVQSTIHAAIAELCERVLNILQNFSGYSHVVMVGGGAPLIETAVRLVSGLRPDRCIVVEDPQFALVNGIKLIG